jgi:hypothetical protein
MAMFDLLAENGTRHPIHDPANYTPVHLNTIDRVPPQSPWAHRIPGAIGGAAVASHVEASLPAGSSE